jgi:hypothetical protein
MHDTNDSLVGWMIAGGARCDEPDPRTLAHLVALRKVRRGAHRTSPLAWLAARLRVSPKSPAATDPTMSCGGAA